MKAIQILSFCILLFTYSSVRADMGPKPTMKFYIEMDTQRKSVFIQAFQLQFSEPDGTGKVDTLHENMGRGPEGFFCNSPEMCRSLAYGYKPYQQLMFVFLKDTLFSPIFEKQAFNSSYEVKITADKVEITNTTSWFVRDVNPYSFFRALIITLSVELLSLFLLLFIFKYSPKKPFFIAVLLANLISLPVFWFGVMGVLNSGIGWFVGEFLVVAFETVFVWMYLKKSIPFGKVLAILFFLNFISIMAGGAWLFLSLILS